MFGGVCDPDETLCGKDAVQEIGLSGARQGLFLALICWLLVRGNAQVKGSERGLVYTQAAYLPYGALLCVP